jgi:hypothetical protein
MTAAVTMIDSGKLDFGHLGSVVRFEGLGESLNGMVLMRISHEKRFRTGTFLGVMPADSYERALAKDEMFLQRSGIFLPAGTVIGLEVPENTERPDPGTAGAAVWENVGMEAYRSGEQPWRGAKTEIIDHFLGEGSSFVYSDNDGMLDPDSFDSTDLIEFV